MKYSSNLNFCDIFNFFQNYWNILQIWIFAIFWNFLQIWFFLQILFKHTSSLNFCHKFRFNFFQYSSSLNLWICFSKFLKSSSNLIFCTNFLTFIKAVFSTKIFEIFFKSQFLRFLIFLSKFSYFSNSIRRKTE